MTYNEFVKAISAAKANVGYTLSHTLKHGNGEKEHATLWDKRFGSTGDIYYKFSTGGMSIETWWWDNNVLTCYETPEEGASGYITVESGDMRTQLADVYNCYGSMSNLLKEVLDFVDNQPGVNPEQDFVSIVSSTTDMPPVSLGCGDKPKYTRIHCIFVNDTLHMSMMSCHDNDFIEAFNLTFAILDKITGKPVSAKDSSYEADIERVLDMMGA